MKKKTELEQQIFSCRQCGSCCHGETTVSLDPKDLARMMQYLKMTEEELLQKYLRKTANVIQMQIRDGHCIFYREGCTIHRGKPWRCTQWPLHPSILEDEANLSAIQDSCPGISKKYNYEDFCRILRLYLKADEA